MSYVTCVCFYESGYQWALEARHVSRIDRAITQPRHTSIGTLLLNQPSDPTRWLTLRDATGAWQLGITSDSEILHLPSAAIHPLPPLLAARSLHPALCGVAIEEQSLTLLLNGAQLRLPAAPDSVS